MADVYAGKSQWPEGPRGFPYYSHYWFGKDSASYNSSELFSVLLRNVGVLVMTSLLWIGVKAFGWWIVLIFYGIPYLWLNHCIVMHFLLVDSCLSRCKYLLWIVLITFLQHTDGRLPHFTHSQWTFARGAEATIDRDFGFVDTHLFHSIVGTHVVHHLVSTIPFYHAQEATEAVNKVMGRHYHAYGSPNLMAAFWKNQRDCQFVEKSSGIEGSGVFMFRNLYGRGARPRDFRTGEIMATWCGSMLSKALE